MGSQHQEEQPKQPKQQSQGVRNQPSSNQGEGDYESARRFDREQQEFVATHDTADLGEGAAPKSEQEARDMTNAETRARSRSHARPDDDRMDLDDDLGTDTGAASGDAPGGKPS